MFKKVKSLLLASLLVVSMSGNAFAAEPGEGEGSGGTTATNTCIIKGNAGTHKEEDHLHIITKDDRQTQAKIDAMIKKLKDDVAANNANVKDKYGTENYMQINEEPGKWISVSKKDSQGNYSLIEKIQYEVYTTDDQKEDKGWVDLEITPETGDAIALGGLVIAGVAVVALALNNKKKNKK